MFPVRQRSPHFDNVIAMKSATGRRASCVIAPKTNAIIAYFETFLIGFALRLATPESLYIDGIRER
jgi:hypothetical protein